MLFLRPRRIGKLIRQGDEAQRRRDWRAAYRCYSEIVAARPDLVEIWVQLGHAAKELGQTDRAEQAYREAMQRGGEQADIFVQLGHLLKRQGRRGDAVTAYAEALRLDPDASVPLQELVALGARDAVPDAVFALPRRDRMLAELATKIEEIRHLLDRQSATSILPVKSYDLFRSRYPVPQPPRPCPQVRFRIVIDARDTAPSYLRATLTSLLDQSVGEWRAVIRASPVLFDHPVASFAYTDPRIEFCEAQAPVEARSEEWVVSLPAGILLDSQCLAWLGFSTSIAAAAEAFYADYDHVVDDPVVGRSRGLPILYGAFDPYLLVQTSTPPPVVMMRHYLLADMQRILARWPAAEAHRRMLLAIGERGAVAHLPRVLASIAELPDVARRAPLAGDTIAVAGVLAGSPTFGEQFPLAGGMLELRAGPGPNPVAVAVSADDELTIRVVIPTRDAAGMLATAVDSLLDRSAHRSRVRLTIVDNRSSDPDTLALLDKYRRRGIDVLAMDEPFNWSRANNLAAAASLEPLLVFINNDTAMLTTDWDRVLAGYLQREDVGVVGARLLYPDRTLQHGGAIFFGGSPRHEGVGAAEDEPGPLDRWTSTRMVSAVTGAFLAVRRDRFEAAGGFDEKRLTIAFNDIDFCLKIRSLGLAVIYAAAIELVHHESKTRGFNDTRSKVAWDLEEFRTFRERWSDALTYDPGYNPQWTDSAQPFDGLREPSERCILEHILRSAQRHPWRVERQDGADTADWRALGLDYCAIARAVTNGENS